MCLCFILSKVLPQFLFSVKKTTENYSVKKTTENYSVKKLLQRTTVLRKLQRTTVLRNYYKELYTVLRKLQKKVSWKYFCYNGLFEAFLQ